MRKWDGLRDESGKSFSPTELYEVGRRDKSSTFVLFPLNIPHWEWLHELRKHLIGPSQCGLLQETKTFRQTPRLVHGIFV